VCVHAFHSQESQTEISYEMLGFRGGLKFRAQHSNLEA